MNLTYRDIRLSAMETSLLCLIAHETRAEIYWTEIDREDGADSPVYVHRILWQTRIRIGHDPVDGIFHTLEPEIELRFVGFEMEVVPVTDGNPSRAHGSITVSGFAR